MKLTKQQRILITILNDNKDMELGDIRQKFYSVYEPKSKRLRLSNVMKRNSKMGAWLNQLKDKGLVKIHYINLYFEGKTYNVTDKAILLL